MTAAHVNKLIATEACPCCRAPRFDLISRHGVTHYARADFECGASFLTANGRISVGNPCLDASRLAAHLMNLEVEGKAR